MLLNNRSIFILKRFQSNQQVNKLYLVLEYMKKGDLLKVLKDRETEMAMLSSLDGSASVAGGSLAGSVSVSGSLAQSVAGGTNMSNSVNLSSSGLAAKKSITPLSDLEVWNIFRQLGAGIRYLHYQNIVHGDIKPQVRMGWHLNMKKLLSIQH